MDHPPQNPITRYSPEDRKRLEENTDKMPLVHVGCVAKDEPKHNYFPYVRSTDVVDLFYHMDASFKDDICTICSSPGDLMFCSRCPRGFHVSCLRSADVKDVGSESSRDV